MDRSEAKDGRSLDKTSEGIAIEGGKVPGKLQKMADEIAKIVRSRFPHLAEDEVIPLCEMVGRRVTEGIKRVTDETAADAARDTERFVTKIVDMTPEQASELRKTMSLKVRDQPIGIPGIMARKHDLKPGDRLELTRDGSTLVTRESANLAEDAEIVVTVIPANLSGLVVPLSIKRVGEGRLPSGGFAHVSIVTLEQNGIKKKALWLRNS